MFGLRPLVARIIERLVLPAKAPRAYSFAVPFPSRIVLWQHVSDLRPLGGITKDEWSACAGLEFGTLSWYARPLATRPPPI